MIYKFTCSYGWHSPEWVGDEPYHVPIRHPAHAMPSSFQLDISDIPYLNQGSLPFTTHCGVAHGIHYSWKRQGVKKHERISIDFLDLIVSRYHGVTQSFSGVSIYELLSCISWYGFMSMSRFSAGVTGLLPETDESLWMEAERHTDILFSRVSGSAQVIKWCLLEGIPVIIGHVCFDTFTQDLLLPSSKITLPAHTATFTGGNCGLVWGWCDEAESFNVLSTYGRSIGHDGSYLLPYSYVNNPTLTKEFWVIEQCCTL